MSYCSTQLSLLLVIIFPLLTHFVEAKNETNEDSGDENSKNASKKSNVYDKVMNLRFGSTKVEDIKLYVYSNPEDSNFRQEIKLGDNSSLVESGLIKGTKIIIITHGFMGNLSFGPNDIKNAYLGKKFKNILLLDWSKLSNSAPKILPIFSYLYYFQAKKNSIKTGTRLAEYIQFMKENSYAESYDDFHLIGNSLGAHVMGIAGSTIQNLTGERIGRITGLDPAGPFYSGVSKRFKLSKDDARFVDAIHTDTDAFGTPKSVATADFYANGGLRDKQPACMGKKDVDLRFCAHSQAINYYIDTIEGKEYYGCKCRKAIDLIINQPCEKPKKCSAPELFGEYSSEAIKGNYYLIVNS